MKPSVRNALGKYLLLGVLLPAAAYLVVHYTLLDRAPASPLEELGIDPATFDGDTVSPRLAQQLGIRSRKPATEFVTVIISATFCAANRVEGFHEAARAIPDLIRAQAPNRPDVITRFVGISVDRNPRTGTDYLYGLADFDEVVAGGSWLNTATEKFFWGVYRSEASIPQVVILERTVTWTDNSPLLERERVVIAIVGADSIMAWVDRGAPIVASAERSPAEVGRSVSVVPIESAKR